MVVHAIYHRWQTAAPRDRSMWLSLLTCIEVLYYLNFNNFIIIIIII